MIRSSRDPVYISLFSDFIEEALEQDGLWNFFEFVFKIYSTFEFAEFDSCVPLSELSPVA